MDFNQNGFENQNSVNGSYGYMPYNVPKFVPHDLWNREKSRLKKLSMLAGGAVLLFVVFSGIYSGLYTLVYNAVEAIGGQAFENFNRAVSTLEFEFIFEMLYSVFVVGGSFFLLGYIFYKKGLIGAIPMDKPQNIKYLPLIIIAGFGVCLAGNVINSYFIVIFEMFTDIQLDYSIATEIPTTPTGILMFYLATAVVPALIEELALRGIIMQPLRRYGDWFAIICSALIFGLMHCNLVQIPFAFIAGVVIGYAVIITQSVWTGVIIHFMNNAFSVTVNIIYELYGLESWQYTLCNIMFYLFMIAGAILAYFIVKKFRNKPMYKSPLINQGRNIYGQVHPYSAKVSYKAFYKAYLLSIPMIAAFVMVCYQTVCVMLYL